MFDEKKYYENVKSNRESLSATQASPPNFYVYIYLILSVLPSQQNYVFFPHINCCLACDEGEDQDRDPDHGKGGQQGLGGRLAHQPAAGHRLVRGRVEVRRAGQHRGRDSQALQL